MKRVSSGLQKDFGTFTLYLLFSQISLLVFTFYLTSPYIPNKPLISQTSLLTPINNKSITNQRFPFGKFFISPKGNQRETGGLFFTTLTKNIFVSVVKDFPNWQIEEDLTFMTNRRRFNRRKVSDDTDDTDDSLTKT